VRQRRYLYVLLFALPALLVSTIAGTMMLAASAGVLWLFVLGDNPWPPVTDALLGAVFIVGTAALWVALLFVAYTVGKQEEARPTFNTGHVALSIGATVVLVAVIAMRLTGLGGSAGRGDSEVCADLCRAQGFAASGTPPRDSGNRTCSCYDAQGRETRRVPLPKVP
jgi:hypothetical protein